VQFGLHSSFEAFHRS